MTPHLSVDELAVSLGGTSILRDVSFVVDRGEMIGLVGPNGSGKTTLLRCLAGTQEYSGSIQLDGREVREWRARSLARAMAFLRQKTALEFDFTVEQLVLLGRSPHRGWLESYGASDHRRAHDALERVEMGDFKRRSVLTLSGGELQRAMLAQALVQEAPLLVLDEPTAHLDVHHRFEFMEIVAELSGTGRTLITVFHDLDLAARFSRRLLVLNHGRLVADGSPVDVLTEHLLSDVFRMDAEVSRTPGGEFAVRFLGPSGSTRTAPPSANENLHPHG